jgi:hypothetical protein
VRASAEARARCAAALIWLLIADCRPNTEHTPQPPPAAPAVVSNAPVLSALQRARLDYLLDAARLVARHWPRMQPDQTCVLLVEQTTQWMLNCATAPAGFTPGSETFRGRPVFAHSGDAFEVAGQRRSTRELLSLTPAAAEVAAGVAGGSTWLLLGSLEALAAYHPAFPEASSEAWVSVAIHEFVHTHQLREPSLAVYRERIQTRAFDAAPLEALFREHSDYHALVEREYALLVAAALKPPQAETARRALRAWQALYRKRRANLAARSGGAGVVERDLLFSYLEGVARYVESTFLEHAPDHPNRGIANDPRFHDYTAFLDRGYAASPNRQLDDAYYYAIGYHLCVLLERIDPAWPARASSQPEWLVGAVETALLAR